jgi:MoCo/4Fe-4S cofactor protein with predicted Tat translocation signal
MSLRDDVPARPIDLDSVRRTLAGATGKRFWRGLDELAETPAFVEYLHREFPLAASEFDDPAGRREFLRVMGASLAFAGLTSACTRQPEEKIVPYVRMPEQIIPGKPLYFATAMTLGGYAKGLLVESHMGRPTKVEGNPDHPASLGATDIFGQAHVLGLYDPDRSQTLLQLGEIRPWGALLSAVKAALHVASEKGRPLGLRLLSGSVTSPSLAAQIDALLAAFPGSRWHQYEPVGRDNARAGARLAFGEAVAVQHRFEKADVILSLDADFISHGPASLRDIRAFTSRRKVSGSKAEMNRLYVVESSPSLTGANADHLLPLRPSAIEGFARAVAAGLGLAVEGGVDHAWVKPLVADLKAHQGKSLIVAGEWQPPIVHALAHAMNQQLGNAGRSVVYTAEVEPHPAEPTSLAELVADMNAGTVDLLLVLDGNPVYAAPVDLEFAKAMDNVPLRIHWGLYDDETAERCHWHVPASHALEAWGDARAFDGTVTIQQPLIAPLYGGTKSAHEFLAVFTPRPERAGHDLVKEYWKSTAGAADFEHWWQHALHDGVVAGSALAEKTPHVALGAWARAGKAAPGAGLELAFRPDPSIYDGQFANNGWLQELPKHLSKATWDNVAIMSLETARALGVQISASFDGQIETAGKETASGCLTDVVELAYKGRRVTAPAWIVPGSPNDVVTVYLGYGRRKAGRVGSGAGYDAYALRTSDAPWFGAGLEVQKAGGRVTLAITQTHWSLEGRNIVRAASVEEYDANPHFVHEKGHTPPRELTMYPGFEYNGHKWGMAIDLNSCVGCNACVTACQSENNIPVVGKDQVARGREMHWIRIDRYYASAQPSQIDVPETYHQPMLCQHCEDAPCEVVCPVAATVHSDEGLNDMVYNRCVGTRYCSNNCPYKVRRFNFLLYQDWTTESIKLQRNPDVTVRSRGVMEKCTYCVQRINETRITAKNEGREIKDGEIKTACQQACPAEAIVFGDVNDKSSRVSQLKQEPRNYGVLDELNTKPRTSYLAAVRNPNPEMPHV